MKLPGDIEAAILRRLDTTWHLDVAAGERHWPHAITVGTVSRNDLQDGFTDARAEIESLRVWASDHDLEVVDANRRVHGTIQPIPTHVIVHDIDLAARIGGKQWTDRVARGRDRAATLSAHFPDCTAVAKVVRLADDWSEVDFDLLVTVASWWSTNTSVGLTPRQVPIPGVHAKWLNTRRPAVEMLVGRPFDLAARHPPRIHLTYLDEKYLASGGRRYDSATAGDVSALAYEPAVIVISENKDTAIHFPGMAGGMAVEGGGFGGATAARFTWLVGAPLVVYWGDIDAEGFEILDGFRRSGVPATSILMDLKTLRSYAVWGTDLDKGGRPIRTRNPKDLLTLTSSERAAYEVVCRGTPGLPVRLEQERIPLTVAHAAVMHLQTGSTPLIPT